eukprot:CAMPEP_0174885776 /NCGR_PEP_ID=MMETSP0167-20121228/1053_1 /TAXON_ID=38298 /ORGANISM="Rhodella maculata, Strain CCMP736" /LENGTH=70 /DNA_ID=CAMNT_0016121481 /DNA_START=71 /DNA_END=283 /DNA_ORIENTATION=-
MDPNIDPEEDFGVEIGTPSADAVAAIKAKDPSLQVDVLPSDCMMTMDYRLDRVRVMVDKDDTVCEKPRRG